MSVDPRGPEDPRNHLDTSTAAVIAPTRHPRIPRFVKAVIGIAVFGICVVSSVAWQLADVRDDQEHERCLRSVIGRQDSRAMWLALFEVFPEEAVETGLREDLERLLPPLRCDGHTPVPLSD